jgi:hypothetical protein
MATGLARLQAGDVAGARASLGALPAPPYTTACLNQEGLQRPLGLLWEPRTVDPPHGWGTAVWSFAGSREIIVEAPHPKADKHTEAMAITAFGHADARALLIAGAHRHARPGAGVAHDDASAYEALHRQLLAGRAGGVVVQFHGFSSDNHPELKNAGVQIVVTSAPNSALSRAIAAALAPRWHATTEADRLEGTTNVHRASTVSAGLTFVHVEVESELRRADEGAEVARAVSDAIAQHVDALRRR